MKPPKALYILRDCFLKVIISLKRLIDVGEKN